MNEAAERLPSLAPTLISAAAVILGWYATHFFTRKRENETRRLTTALEYRERQVREFYGPLLSLIEQIQTVHAIKTKLLNAGTEQLSDDSVRKIDHYFWERYFDPLHVAVRELFRTKLFLLEGGKAPASFGTYLTHSIQEKAQKELWSEFIIDTSFLKGTSYPRDFDTDVKETLNKLLSDYQGDISALEEWKEPHR
jgi:hypothetical protein